MKTLEKVIHPKHKRKHKAQKRTDTNTFVSERNRTWITPMREPKKNILLWIMTEFDLKNPNILLKFAGQLVLDIFETFRII